MCREQQVLFAKVNLQLAIVQELVQDLKSEFKSLSKINPVCPGILTIFGIMESLLLGILPLDDEDLDDYEIESDWELKFSNRTYSEIIGIHEADTETIFSEVEQNPPNMCPEPQEQLELDTSTFKRGPYRSYKTHEKLNVVKLYKEGKSYAFISRLLKIPQKNIVRWCKTGIHRKEGAGRKIGDADMQKKVVEWIQKSLAERRQITGKAIRNKAMEFSTKKDFKSSKGWLKNFVRRHRISIKYG